MRFKMIVFAFIFLMLSCNGHVENGVKTYVIESDSLEQINNIGLSAEAILEQQGYKLKRNSTVAQALQRDTLFLEFVNSQNQTIVIVHNIENQSVVYIDIVDKYWKEEAINSFIHKLSSALKVTIKLKR